MSVTITAHPSFKEIKSELIDYLPTDWGQRQIPSLDTQCPKSSKELELEEITIEYDYNLFFTHSRAKGGSDEYGNVEILEYTSINDIDVTITSIINDCCENIEISTEQKTELENIIKNAISNKR